MTDQSPSQPKAPEHPLVNLVVNILIPVFILNKGTPYLGAKTALIIAMSLPLIYGLQDYLRNRHKNYVSILGLFNIVLTGGLALLQLHGMWFSVKEALLPLTLGLLVLFSAKTESPAAQIMFCNAHVMNMKEIEESLAQRGNQLAFRNLLRSTTLWLSVSFFISSLLNFLLAMQIFTNIDGSLAQPEQSAILNEQIAKMTWMAMLVIALPLMVFSAILITWFLKKLTRLTGLPMETLIKS